MPVERVRASAASTASDHDTELYGFCGGSGRGVPRRQAWHGMMGQSSAVVIDGATMFRSASQETHAAAIAHQDATAADRLAVKTGLHGVAEAVANEGLEDWIGAHSRLFAFLGGMPGIVVPDNLKAAASKADRFDPGLNRTLAPYAFDRWMRARGDLPSGNYPAITAAASLARRSLNATISARSTTTAIIPNPTETATAQDVSARVQNVAAVMTAKPMAVPMRWPVCMMVPELPA